MSNRNVTRRDCFALAPTLALAGAPQKFPIRPDYLREHSPVPDFWRCSVDEVTLFLKENVRQGSVSVIGNTAGGRPIRAVFYGRPRGGRGSTTFSGALGYGDVRAWIGPDHERKVYLAMASVHGAEFEGIVGAVNLLSVLESGKDLRGREWPEISAAARRLDRIVIIPITNVDGRARVPLRMIPPQGADFTVSEYFNTGGKLDGSIIGWPQCKRDIPVDFSKVQFPGGYPNDAGVNIQHDDFFGKRQPETGALFELAARERPDLTLNMHTGADFLHPLRPFLEPVLTNAFEDLYRQVMTQLTAAGLQRSDDPAEVANPARERLSVFNLDSALNMHCGSLSVLVESPSHAFSRAKRNGRPFFHTPENLLDAQLICHQEAMKFLAGSGGQVAWRARPKA
ncbi:MAG: hypothetical protein IT158_08060 [Bryobacterales bacterium]|nr:hypothetical protein [Bryobacterales bacterium]